MKIKPFSSACKIIKKSITKKSKNEYIEISNAENRILAKNIIAKNNFPSNDVSSMDGIVILEKDKGKSKFKIVGESKAGDIKSNEFKSNQAKLIYTGAIVPGKRKKIVIPKENFFYNSEKNYVILNKNTYENNYIRKQGIDFKKKQICMLKDTVLSIRSIALAKTLQIKNILVKKKIKVLIILTGDELKTQKNSSGYIEPSNKVLICNLIKKFGGEIQNVIHVKDKKSELYNTLKLNTNFDLLITCGGISKGKYDIVKETLVDFGFKILFDSVAMRPGKPTTFGKIGNNKFFLGVPGNPVSCFIASIMFLPLIINSFYGVKLNNLVRIFLISNSKKIINSKFTNFLRIKINKKSPGFFSIFKKQDSSLQTILSDSDGVIEVVPKKILLRREKKVI